MCIHYLCEGLYDAISSMNLHLRFRIPRRKFESSLLNDAFRELIILLNEQLKFFRGKKERDEYWYVLLP